MPDVLRFGISSLDELLGVPNEKSLPSDFASQPQPASALPSGVYLPKLRATSPPRARTDEIFNTSICIIGPTGTGKSIFALHMASKYLADCIDAEEALPIVLYVSTDLTFNMANRAWTNFNLRCPFIRSDPFSTGVKKAPQNPYREILLNPLDPNHLAEKFESIVDKRGQVIFVDMASNTAGDDWGFLHKLISLLPAPADDNDPRHLIVMDAIEGFEALAGELNAFGQKSTRRSRIAQVMRLITGKCHAVLVVEESSDYVKNESLAEAFIADSVIRLDNLSSRNYERRVLKVEKVRGQSHIRGQHHYSIRSGKGSTTGSQVNPDDPEVPVPTVRSETDPEYQSYVQVFHSVHRLSRQIMEVKGKAREKLEPDKYYAAFGIKYLDNMLGGKAETANREPASGSYTGTYYDSRGLPSRSTTALIGDSLTQKSNLGKAFLSRCFSSFKDQMSRIRELLKKPVWSKEDQEEIWTRVNARIAVARNIGNPPKLPLEPEGENFVGITNAEDLAAYIRLRVDPKADPLPITSRVKGRNHLFGKKQLEKFLANPTEAEAAALSELIKEAEQDPAISEERLLELDGKLPQFRSDFEQEIVAEARLTHLAAWLVDYKSGVAVMLVTHNVHHEQLAREFVTWLHEPHDLIKLNDEMPGYQQAFESYVKGGTICRRLEIHSLSSEVLIHMVQQLTRAAQLRILTAEEMKREDTRYERSWPIRVVIDDFSAFRDIFPELREDPLLLPSLLFHFEREGVTTLIVDTQSGKPDIPIAERFESELRKMVHHNLYTWRVPFYGESRVGITAIPPLSSEYAGIVREVRWESESFGQDTSSSTEPPMVDPHFELYTGLEEGNAQPVPLHARFYAETEAMKTFIDNENKFLSERFIFHDHPAQPSQPCIIFGMPAAGYDEVRDLAYLQRDTRLNHTLLFQVDEFWTMRKPSQHKRAGAFHPQQSYLDSITALAKNQPQSPDDYKSDLNADPYELFQLRADDDLLPLKDPKKPEEENSLELRRRHFYEKYYEDFNDYEKFKSLDKQPDVIDRVPFSWDFGFLLCQERAWKTGKHITFPHEHDQETYTVREVWQSLTKAQLAIPDKTSSASTENKELSIRDYVSWRVFIEACKKAAEAKSDELSKPVRAFDFAQISPESFSCLILEIWLSEIYDRLKRPGAEPGKLESLKEMLSKRQLFSFDKASTVSEAQRWRLADMVRDYWLELYKSWLLLIEVLDFPAIIGDATAHDFAFESKNTDFSAIASRHWYKTASQCPNDIAAKEPLVAVRLPGHFSVRGDWFLAVAGGSRSIRQAERALDLLSSRRANTTRLQLGIGLPTRVPRSKSETGESPLGMLRTKLISHQWGQDSVDYETFLKIGAPKHEASPASPIDQSEEFYWLWRSSLDDYAHCNRIWHNWLNRTVLWWNRKLLRYKSVWVNSFKVYDDLTREPPTFKEFAPETPKELIEVEGKFRQAENKEAFLKQYTGLYEFPQLKVRTGFLQLKDILIKELKQASDVKHLKRPEPEEE